MKDTVVDPTHYNAALDERVVIKPEEYRWIDSPMPGVERMRLDRNAPNSAFSPHTHTGGEEFYVLEGAFADEHAVYPAGSWLRSPHLSKHTPYTKGDGALIYVKTGHL